MTEIPRRATSGKARILALLALAVLSSACQPSASSNPVSSPSPQASTPAEDGPTLVAFGDSLTEGLGVDPDKAYPAQLEKKLQAEGLNWKVVNAGLSGETSSGARSRLEWVLKLEPDAVILETGGNDGLRGIDPKVTRENIGFLLDELKKQQIPVMLVGMKTLSNLGPDYTGPFESLYPDLAREKSVPLIPFFLEGVAGSVELNQDDRIHPTERGYTLIVERLSPTVAPWLKGLTPAPAQTTPTP